MGKTPPRRLRRTLAATAAFAALALAAGPALAEDAHAISIPAGPLDQALLSLAGQTGHQLLYSPELVRGRAAPALSGRFTADEALQRLLVDTGVGVARAGPKVLVLKPRADGATAPGPASSAGEAARPFADEGGAFDAPPSPPPQPPAIMAASPGAQAVVLDGVQVTGSHIRGGLSPSPLLVLDRDALDRSGHANVAAALNALPQNFSGVATEGTITTGADSLGRNAAYATGVNLRGLGSDATLVLVNGRRLAGSGSFGDFADVSAIPTAAVERIEVLLDGASALYGSDAVGGVVNIILKRDFDGAEARLLAGVGTAGEPAQGQAAVTLGRRWDGGGVLLAYEAQVREPLPSSARRFSADADLRSLGGSDHRLVTAFPGNILRLDPATGTLVPGWAIPAGQDGTALRPEDLRAGEVNLESPRQGVDLLPRQSLQSVYLAADHALGDRLELSGDARYAFRRFRLHGTAPMTSLTVTSANPYFVSPTGASSHTIAYSFAEDLGNPLSSGSAETLSLSLGARLRLPADWRSDGHLAFAQEIDEGRNSGVLNTAHLNEALGRVPDRPETPFSTARDGFFNPFTGVPGANNSAVLAHIGSGFVHSRTRSRVASANLQADGSLMRLPGGELKLAVGAQARRETLVRAGTNYISTVLPTPQQPTDVAREVVAAFAELRAPIFGPDNRRPGFERLEVSLAGRIERYDDVGRSANPKLGLLWEPADGLRVRGTWGRSFRAPSLREVHDPALNNMALFPLGGGRLRSLLLSGGNPDLEPETAVSWTLGLDLAPPQVPGLRLGLTWFDVRFEDRIERPVSQNILNALTDPTLAPFVRRIAPATNPADHALISALLADPATSGSAAAFPPEAYGAIVDNRYVNAAELRVRGLDASAAYAFDLAGDRLALAANASWLVDYERRVTPTSPRVDRVDVAGFPAAFRARATADWTRERLTFGGAVNHVGAYRDSEGAGIRAHMTVDLHARLAPARHGSLDGVAVALHVRNLFDRDPPFYDNPAGLAYDPASADPIGRFVSLQLTRAW